MAENRSSRPTPTPDAVTRAKIVLEDHPAKDVSPCDGCGARVYDHAPNCPYQVLRDLLAHVEAVTAERARLEHEAVNARIVNSQLMNEERARAEAAEARCARLEAALERMKSVGQCPVCGFREQGFQPADYQICSQCGTEFGYDDATKSHDELRAAWEAKGKPWFDQGDPAYQAGLRDARPARGGE